MRLRPQRGERMKCAICEEEPTHPVCESCLTTEIEDWLGKTRPELIEEVRKIKSSFESYKPLTNCIQCDGYLKACSHCFTKEVFEMIKEKAPALKEDFERQFNYEITDY